MGNRLKKALQALALVLVITFACLAFMPWSMSDVIEGLDDVERCMILRYNEQYSTAYPQGEQLEQLKLVLQGTKGHFDRNREGLVYWGEEPLYRIYFWTEEGRIPDIWLCGTAIFYEGTQYSLGEEVAAVLNGALEACFLNH